MVSASGVFAIVFLFACTAFVISIAKLSLDDDVHSPTRRREDTPE